MFVFFFTVKAFLVCLPNSLFCLRDLILSGRTRRKDKPQNNPYFSIAKMWDVRRQLPCNHAPQVSVCGDYWSWGPGPGATKQFAAFRLNPFLLFKQSKAPKHWEFSARWMGFHPETLVAEAACWYRVEAPDAQLTLKSRHGFVSRQHQGMSHKVRNEGMMQYDCSS